jgi:hypothetical protein
MRKINVGLLPPGGAVSEDVESEEPRKSREGKRTTKPPRRDSCGCSNPERGAVRELLLLGAPKRQWPLPTLLWALVAAF